MSAGGVPRLPRLMVVVWGLLLRHFLLLVQVSGVEVVPWYKVQISQDTLQRLTPTEIMSRSKMQCAVLASQDTENQHLFCQPDADTCSIYNLKIAAGRDESANGPVQNCWTKHPAVCESGGRGYLEGETYEDIGTCSFLQCQSGAMVPIKGNTPSNLPLSDLLAENCIFLDATLRTFGDARSFCQSQGGDLYVPEDFKDLQDYLSTKPYNQVWVGGKSKKWLDGRPLTTTEWGPGDPDGAPNDCIRMAKSNGNPHLMMDCSCSKSFSVMCHKGVAYP